jgi:hypothetical protein
MASITEPFRGDVDHTSSGYPGGMERDEQNPASPSLIGLLLA